MKVRNLQSLPALSYLVFCNVLDKYMYMYDRLPSTDFMIISKGSKSNLWVNLVWVWGAQD